MTQPGWYPDPDPARAGGLRYWDGTAWTDRTGETPTAPRRRNRARMLLAVIALVLVLALALGFILLRSVSPRSAGPGPTSTVVGGNDSSPQPTATRSPTASTVPTQSDSGAAEQPPCPVGLPAQERPRPASGRVRGGPLSFAALPAPWSAPGPTNRVPHSRDGNVQTLLLPEDLPWQASAEVGILDTDLPGRPRAVEMILDCILDSDFYASVNVRVTGRTAEELTIGRTPATRLDARLEFRHPRLRTTGSDLRIIAVGSTPVTYYFHAVPQERADLIAALDRATATLALD